MKKLATVFRILAFLLSHVMCARVAYCYCAQEWGQKYAGWSAGPEVAFFLAIPYLIGMIVCILLAIFCKKKAAGRVAAA